MDGYRILVTAEPLQEQSFDLFGYKLRFTLRFNSISGLWNYDLFDLEKETFICQSFGLAVDAPSLISMNLPFVVVMEDLSGLGINSIHQSEMGKRLQVAFVDKRLYREAVRTSNKAVSR